MAKLIKIFNYINHLGAKKRLSAIKTDNPVKQLSSTSLSANHCGHLRARRSCRLCAHTRNTDCRCEARLTSRID